MRKEFQISRRGSNKWSGGDSLKDALALLREKLRRYHDAYGIKVRGEGNKWSRYRPLDETIKRVREIEKRGAGKTLFIRSDAGSKPFAVWAIRVVEFDVPDPPGGITPAIRELWIAAHEEFPSIGSLGVYNCRKIAGSSTWSQHAWGNAWDAAGSLALLKDYEEWVRSRRAQFAVHYIAGVAEHPNHVHVDCDPYRSPPPPCAP